jgi:hypothetical protein
MSRCGSEAEAKKSGLCGAFHAVNRAAKHASPAGVE